MSKFFTKVPVTWEVKFSNYYQAHSIYKQLSIYLDESLGHSLVNNDCWYINTTLGDTEFQNKFESCISKLAKDDLEYSLSKTQVGTYGPWVPGPWSINK